MSEYNAKNYTEQGGDVTHIGGKLIIEEGATVEGLPGSGGDLPEVTSADNGKLLGVTEGEWGKVDAPSGGSLPVKSIIVTGTTSAANVNVTFPQGFNRSELETYAEGPRDYILQVLYGSGNTPRRLQFGGFDGTYAMFSLMEYAVSSEPVFNLMVAYIAYLENEACPDRVYFKMIPIAG